MERFPSSDWLKAVQFEVYTTQKHGKTVIYTFRLRITFFWHWITFSYTLLIVNSMISRAIWENKHSWVFRRPRTAHVLRTRAILIVFDKLVQGCFFPNCTGKRSITCINWLVLFDIDYKTNPKIEDILKISRFELTTTHANDCDNISRFDNDFVIKSKYYCIHSHVLSTQIPDFRDVLIFHALFYTLFYETVSWH